MSADDADDRTRTRIYFVCGFVLAGLVAAAVLEPGIFFPAWIGWIGVAFLASSFGYASARWGDEAWIWLSDRIRLLTWWH